MDIYTSNPKLLGLQKLLFKLVSLTLFICMPQQVVVLHEEDVNRGSLFCWLQIYDFEYLLQYFVVFYFYFWLFGLTQASQPSISRYWRNYRISLNREQKQHYVIPSWMILASSHLWIHQTSWNKTNFVLKRKERCPQRAWKLTNLTI